MQEGDEEERKRILDKAERGCIVTLTTDNLFAMAQYNETLLEWAVRIRNKY
ncbi:MAG: hypothetical protein OWQ51_02525 [Pyrobaculum arsenaticum]|uniref:Uncharacterized protein n=2 Tax=Pyrobaculum arsenaticum TaxID=121277 RepID=A4WIN8_PYRAR|nr:hypothetical protein [Pyrobaculum arsenaticum]ABP50255.1 hypothetical protein Pars_0664 [Pyrobaculum arsenaticum DSM 13514]MCY0889848.1 hypothetical protein [Pyrobaculum arsenaticum]NYR14807.1 hypothetical protein [Pyrobaculum arsenaticum]